MGKGGTKRAWWTVVGLWTVPLGCLALIGGLGVVSALGPRVPRGDLDLRIPLPGLGPTVRIKIDRGGPPQAPRRISLDLTVGRRG
jgi:hypothetical protein